VSSALQRHPAFAPREPDQWIQAESPGGPLFAAVSDAGVSFVAPAPDAAAFETKFSERTGRRLIEAEPGDHQDIALLLAAGESDLEMCDLETVSPFTRRVLEGAAEIERGQTRSYQWLARHIGMPQASRAVGNALGANPVPVVIPCHRIIRGDGTLGGYAFGSKMKRTLLASEGALEAVASA
jgi:methylated-DNA-[protein]-cysteine S-methyltransferase